MATFTIFVVILGESPVARNMFSVNTHDDTSVDAWKDSVHARAKSRLEGVAAIDLIPYKLNVPIKVAEVDQRPLGPDLSGVAEEMLPGNSLSHYFPIPPMQGSLHVIVVAPGLGSKRRRAEDEASERPLKLQVTTEAPSRAAAPSRFRQLVEDPKVGILCNRPVNDTTIPLALLHPVFGQFADDCRSFKPGHEEYAFTRKLALMADYFGSESQRNQFFNAAFAEYYKFHLFAEEIPGTNRPTDGHAYVTDPKSPKKEYIFVIAEGKNEITNNSSDPRFQAILYYREYVQRFLKPTFHASCLPAILVTYYAANIQVSGIITHPDGTVQSAILTTTHPLDADWREDEYWRVLAQCLGALKNSFETLLAHYKGLPNPPTLLRDPCPPMSFPYPNKCEDITFSYTKRVFPGGLIFSAKEDAHPQRALCIKFSKEYSEKTHRLLSQSGHAPELYGFSRLPGGWVMVVMEEMKHPWALLSSVQSGSRMQFRDAVEKAIQSLHASGYVHGDIRASNVFVFPEDPSQGIKFIDFDEAGVYGEALYPRNLNTWTVRRPPGAVDGEKITKEHDKFMTENLFVQHGAEQMEHPQPDSGSLSRQYYAVWINLSLNGPSKRYNSQQGSLEANGRVHTDDVQGSGQPQLIHHSALVSLFGTFRRPSPPVNSAKIIYAAQDKEERRIPVESNCDLLALPLCISSTRDCSENPSIFGFLSEGENSWVETDHIAPELLAEFWAKVIPEPDAKRRYSKLLKPMHEDFLVNTVQSRVKEISRDELLCLLRNQAKMLWALPKEML